MRKKHNRTSSIYLEMAVLLLLSAAVAGTFGVLTNIIVDRMLDSYVERTEYNRKKSSVYAEDLQEFIDSEEINAEDLAPLEDWTKENPAVILQIYDDNYLLFDSINGVYEVVAYEREDEAAAWENYYYLTFGGRRLEACIYGNFDYAIYDTALAVEITLSALLFFALFLLGMRREISYIRILKEEIELLEGGSLDYEITVAGSDELTELAQGLNSLRVSFKHQIEEAEKLSRANREMVTQMSHDLRTPLTAVLLYAEILQNGKLGTEQQKDEYLEKIIKKIQHMKGLSDRLLTYSSEAQTISGEKAEHFLPARLFYDELSELCGYLEAQGFEVNTELEWAECEITAGEEAVSRIFNNIASNIIKYASKEKPVCISGGKAGEGFFISCRNSRGEANTESESGGIGIKSIRSIMQSFGGSCEVKEAEDSFEIILFFTG